MLRGLFTGALWGVVAGGVGAAGLSLALPQPAGNTTPQTPQVDAPVAAPDAIPVEQPEAPVELSDDAVAAPSVQIATPAPELSAPIADTQTAAIPQTANIAETLTTPDAVVAPEIDVASDVPVLPNPQSIAPQLPLAEDDIVVSTVPAAPIVPDEPDIAAEIARIPSQQVEPAPDDAPAIDTAPDVVADRGGATTADSEIGADVAEPEADESAAVDAIVVEVTPEDPSSAADEPPTIVTVLDESAPALPTGTASVIVRRPASEAGAETNPAEPVDPDAPALVRYGASFENPEGRPIASVVLIDDGSVAGSPQAVAAIPFPVTIALDPSRPDSANLLNAYRQLGIEVAVLAKLPQGATPADVEVTLEAAFGTLPETIAILDAGEGGLQNDPAVTTQAMQALASDGRGLITISKGLNTALRIAEKEAVPAVVVYRDLDGDGQDSNAVRRFLDKAAFRARQDSGVVLLGRVRANTISALILWDTSNRAKQIVLAPVSAVLNTQD